MCTCFIYRGNDTLIAMNYDNYGNNLKLAEYNEDLFLVTINFKGEERALFGIRSDGVFANQQFVDECENGKYIEGQGVVDTISLVERVLQRDLSTEKLDEYLSCHKIVTPMGIDSYINRDNTPNFNIHTMIADVNSNCYIIEPGRENLKFDKNEKYVVMSNCSICDAKLNGKYKGFGADRQIKVEELLEKENDSFKVKDAFNVLKAVQLNKLYEIISTELSFVYSANENVIYYCYNRDFDKIKKYQLLLRGKK